MKSRGQRECHVRPSDLRLCRLSKSCLRRCAEHNELPAAGFVNRSFAFVDRMKTTSRAASGFEEFDLSPVFIEKQGSSQPGETKTDDTDLAAIFRATVNGFGLLLPTDAYLEVQQLSRQRRDLVHKTTVLRCQIKETLRQLMPGYAELFPSHFFDTPVALPLLSLLTR